MSEEEYSEPQESLGEFLRRHREASHRNLDDLARATRISKRYLLAFENDDLDNLPESPFDRGFLRSYAMELGLDPEECLDRYDRFRRSSMPTQIRDIRKTEKSPVILGNSPQAPVQLPRTWFLGAAIIGIVLVLGALVAWLALRSSSNDVAVETAPITSSAEPQPEDPKDTTAPKATATANVLEIEAQKKATLLIRVDSLAEQEILLEPGQNKQVEFKNKISIDGKDRALVKLKLNGEVVASKDFSGPTILYNPSSVFP